MSLSANAVQAALAPETSEVYLVLAEISHSTIQTPMRFVNNTENITHSGQSYQACGFKFIPPNSSSDNGSPSRVTIDNIDRYIMEQIELIPNSEPMEIAFKVVLASSPDTVEWESGRLYLKNISADVQQITGDLYDVYISDRILPGLSFTPFDFPGLF